MTGEAIKGYHREGKYYLTKNKEEVNYYKKRANRLLSKASPLMEIYREDHSPAYNSFLQEDAETEGNRYAILSSLSLHTTTTEFITRILNYNQIPQEEQMQIQQYISGQRDIARQNPVPQPHYGRNPSSFKRRAGTVSNGAASFRHVLTKKTSFIPGRIIRNICA